MTTITLHRRALRGRPRAITWRVLDPEPTAIATGEENLITRALRLAGRRAGVRVGSRSRSAAGSVAGAPTRPRSFAGPGECPTPRRCASAPTCRSASSAGAPWSKAWARCSPSCPTSGSSSAVHAGMDTGQVSGPSTRGRGRGTWTPTPRMAARGRTPTRDQPPGGAGLSVEPRLASTWDGCAPSSDRAAATGADQARPCSSRATPPAWDWGAQTPVADMTGHRVGPRVSTVPRGGRPRSLPIAAR